MRIQLHNGSGGVGRSVVVNRLVNFLGYPCGNLVELLEIIHRQLCTAILVRFPTIEFVGGIEVGKTGYLIKTRQICLVDTFNGKASRTHFVVLDEVGIDTVTDFQLQFVGNEFRNDNLVLTLLIAELRQFAFHHIIFNKGGVELWSHTFHYHT